MGRSQAEFRGVVIPSRTVSKLVTPGDLSCDMVQCQKVKVFRRL